MKSLYWKSKLHFKVGTKLFGNTNDKTHKLYRVHVEMLLEFSLRWSFDVLLLYDLLLQDWMNIAAI